MDSVREPAGAAVRDRVPTPAHSVQLGHRQSRLHRLSARAHRRPVRHLPTGKKIRRDSFRLTAEGPRDAVGKSVINTQGELASQNLLSQYVRHFVG